MPSRIASARLLKVLAGLLATSGKVWSALSGRSTTASEPKATTAAWSRSPICGSAARTKSTAASCWARGTLSERSSRKTTARLSTDWTTWVPATASTSRVSSTTRRPRLKRRRARGNAARLSRASRTVSGMRASNNSPSGWVKLIPMTCPSPGG